MDLIIFMENGATMRFQNLQNFCNVSIAAPYAHFKNKAELIDAMREKVINLLMQVLEKTLVENKKREEIFIELGTAYVCFFYFEPHYYNLLFADNSSAVNYANNEALGVLERELTIALKPRGFDKTAINKRVISMWSLVQGLTDVMYRKLIIDRLDKNLTIENNTREILKTVAII